MFDDYSRIACEAKYITKHEEGLKILTPKQMLQRLPIALAQVKVCNRSQNLLNKIRQTHIFFVLSKKNYWKSIQQYNESNEGIMQK